MNTDITLHLQIARVPGLARLMAAAGLMTRTRWEQHRAGIFGQLRKVDVRRRFPFGDGSVEAIHISHMLSNLPRRDAAHCLRECYRVLQPGGVLRISTLDLDATVAAYDPANPDVFLDLIFDLDTSSRAKNRHWWHYNERSLCTIVHAAGFRTIERCRFQEGRCPDVERIDSRPGSLFLEAVK